MKTKRKIRDLTGEEIAALWAFAQNEGRTWKAKLTDVYWFNARIWGGATYRDEGAILHALRNDPRWGHEGLALLTYAELETLAEGQGLKEPAPELSPPAPKGWGKAETSTEDQKPKRYRVETRATVIRVYIVEAENEKAAIAASTNASADEEQDQGDEETLYVGLED